MAQKMTQSEERPQIDATALDSRVTASTGGTRWGGIRRREGKEATGC